MRHPLTRALASAGLTALDVATQLRVDPKTVDRWFAGRVPYPRYRNELSRLTGWTVADLWPSTVEREPRRALDEVRITYANRSLVPADTWRSLFRGAKHAIDIVAYSALFLLEDRAIVRILSERASAGVSIRLALGDPDAEQVARRGSDEQIGDAMAARINNALVLIEPLRGLPNLQVGLHNTVLYASIFRADDDLFVNAHVYGVPASHSPVMHLDRLTGDSVGAAYVNAIDRVWASVCRQVD